MEVQTCHVGSSDTARVLCAYPVGMRILSPFSNFSASSSKGYRSTSLASQNGRLSSLLWFLWYECEWAYCLICLVGASDFCLNFIFARLSFLWIKLLVWLFVCLFVHLSPLAFLRFQLIWLHFRIKNTQELNTVLFLGS